MISPRLERQGDGRFHLTGDVIFESVPSLWTKSKLLFAPFQTLEIDLGAITRADSASIALLVEWTRAAQAQGKSIRFFRLPVQMGAMIEVSDLDGLLPVEGH